MKGHLGFLCRRIYCAPPGPVQNLRQLGDGYGASLGNYASVTWDAPLDSGSQPITGYEVQRGDLVNGVVINWTPISPTGVIAEADACELLAFRVRAANACGYGPWSVITDLTYAGDYASSSFVNRAYTASASIQLPCSGVLKVWCIGPGGTYAGGGAGGAIAWKTFYSVDWTFAGVTYTPQITIRNVANNDGPALASVTVGSTTVTAYGAQGTTPGTHEGGDGGRNGGPGYGTNTQTFTLPEFEGRTYGGQAYWGGAAGGEGDTGLPARAVGQCRRIPLNPTYFGDLASVADYANNARGTELCIASAAVGSGGVRLLTDGATLYGSLVYNQETNMFDEVPPPITWVGETFFAAGFGGGGFDQANPGGAGCVIVRYG